MTRERFDYLVSKADIMKVNDEMKYALTELRQDEYSEIQEFELNDEQKQRLQIARPTTSNAKVMGFASFEK